MRLTNWAHIWHLQAPQSWFRCTERVHGGDGQCGRVLRVRRPLLGHCSRWCHRQGSRRRLSAALRCVCVCVCVCVCDVGCYSDLIPTCLFVCCLSVFVYCLFVCLSAYLASLHQVLPWTSWGEGRSTPPHSNWLRSCLLSSSTSTTRLTRGTSSPHPLELAYCVYAGSYNGTLFL